MEPGTSVEASHALMEHGGGLCIIHMSDSNSIAEDSLWRENVLRGTIPQKQ
jgi:hypothetical protein